MLGIADENRDAPALCLADQHRIPVFIDPVALLAQTPADLIINVSLNPAMGSLIQKHKQPHAEVLRGQSIDNVKFLIYVKYQRLAMSGFS